MTDSRYKNRQTAGKKLAAELTAYANRDDVIVLALPRGGVPVAYEIAQALHAPLDVFIVRKLGVPGHSELAMGAIAIGGANILNESIIRDLNITQMELEAVINKEQKELIRRESAYRHQRPFPIIKNKTVILVDDGIATGATMRVAIRSLRELDPESIVVAVPVAEKSVCENIRLLADEVVCPITPAELVAVGSWYEDFAQTEDEEVARLLS